WDLLHPWYECFVPTSFLTGVLSQLLEELPLHYASLVHVVPIAKQKAGQNSLLINNGLLLNQEKQSEPKLKWMY
ncbi:hypothetical protein MXE01_15660, partial [Legionella pneumophila]|nr:hypothetical protein [Legionella pneumophila]